MYDNESGAYGYVNDDVNDSYVYDDPETQFQNEYNYQARVGGYLENNELVGLRKKDGTFMDASQRFVALVAAVAIEMSDTNLINIKGDVSTILALIPRFKNIQYKNPTAFVLGFWVTRNTKQYIDTHAFEHVKHQLDNLSHLTRDYDIIRYARLWINQYNIM